MEVLIFCGFRLYKLYRTIQKWESRLCSMIFWIKFSYKVIKIIFQLWLWMEIFLAAADLILDRYIFVKDLLSILAFFIFWVLYARGFFSFHSFLQCIVSIVLHLLALYFYGIMDRKLEENKRNRLYYDSFYVREQPLHFSLHQRL